MARTVRIFLVLLLTIATAAKAQVISLRQTGDGRVVPNTAIDLTIPDTIEMPVIKDTVLLSFRYPPYQDSAWNRPMPADANELSFSTPGWHDYSRGGPSYSSIPRQKIKTGRRSFRLEYSYNASMCGMAYVPKSRYEIYSFDRKHRLRGIKSVEYVRISSIEMGPSPYVQQQTLYYDKSGRLSCILDYTHKNDTLISNFTRSSVLFYDAQNRLKYYVLLRGDTLITQGACDSLMTRIWSLAALPDSLGPSVLRPRYEQLIDSCGYDIVNLLFYQYENDRLVSAWNVGGFPVLRDSLIYDAKGRIIFHSSDNVQQLPGKREEFRYDSISGKLSGMRTWEGKSHRWNYREEEYQYDAAGRMEYILVPDPKKVMRRSIRFVYPESKPGKTK